MNVEPWEIWQLPGGCLLYLHSRFGRLPDEERSQAPLSMMPRGKYRGAAKSAPPTPSSILMPFGQYKGLPLAVILRDANYVGWLLAQDWFAEKFPEHRECLAAGINADTGPSAA